MVDAISMRRVTQALLEYAVRAQELQTPSTAAPSTGGTTSSADTRALLGTLLQSDHATGAIAQKIKNGRLQKLRSSVETLRGEIDDVRSAIQQKYTDAQRLLGEVEANVKEAKALRKQNTLILAFAGVPASDIAVSLVIDNQKYTDLDKALSAAKTSSKLAGQAVLDFDELYFDTLPKLTALQEKQNTLEAALAKPSSIPLDGLTVRTCAADVCLSHRKQLVENLKAQKTMLQGLKNQGLGVEKLLDGLIEELDVLVQQTEALVEEAREGLLDSIEALFSEDPRAAARKLIRGEFDAWLEQTLESAGITGPLRDRLMQSPARPQLVEEIAAEAKNQTGAGSPAVRDPKVLQTLDVLGIREESLARMD